jgi:hypothetical protein
MAGCMAASGFGIHFGEGDAARTQGFEQARHNKKGRDYSRPKILRSFAPLDGA